MTRRGIVLLVACGAFVYAYNYALTWGIGHALALPIPLAWRNSFPTRLSGVLTWLILVHTLALLIVSVPFAFLIARFGGRHALAIALGITIAIFAVFSLPPFIEFFAMLPLRTKIVDGIDQIKLIVALPLLVWLMRKLPSNNRWSGP